MNAAGTNITGTLALQGVSGQVVTVQGATIAADQAAASFTLTGIRNPVVTGPSGTFGIQTQDGSGTPINEDTSVGSVTIGLTPAGVPGTSGLALLPLAAALAGAALVLTVTRRARQGGGRASA